MSKTLLERFNERWVLEPETGCWLWISRLNKNGYGRFYTESGKIERAHRVSYQLHVGPIPEGLQVRHSYCGNKLCVNPSHLTVGNQEDNERDKKNYLIIGGEEHYKALLTNAQVAEIRVKYAAGGITQRALAEEYGVSRIQVNRIVNRVHWKSVQ